MQETTKIALGNSHILSQHKIANSAFITAITSLVMLAGIVCCPTIGVDVVDYDFSILSVLNPPRFVTEALKEIGMNNAVTFQGATSSLLLLSLLLAASLLLVSVCLSLVVLIWRWRKNFTEIYYSLFVPHLFASIVSLFFIVVLSALPGLHAAWFLYVMFVVETGVAIYYHLNQEKYDALYRCGEESA